MKKYIHLLLLLSLILWYGLLAIKPIELYGTDTGRLIKNGEIIAASFTDQINKDKNLFNSNYYSYLYSDYPFINHHWGAGIIFYLIFKYFGFVGLHLFSILINLSAVLIFFRRALAYGNFWAAYAAAFAFIPMFALRHEVRPELFSYLFLALFFLILLKYRDNKKTFKSLYFLPGLMLLWVNLHIYYVFGYLLLLLFFIDTIIRDPVDKKSIKKYAFIAVLTLAAGLANPHGLVGLLYPLNIFNNYGVVVAENISLYSVSQLGLLDKSIILMFLISVIFYLILYLSILTKIHWKQVYLYWLIFSIFAFLGWLITRVLALYAFFAIPLISIALKDKKAYGGNAYMAKKTAVFLLITIIALAISINKNNIVYALDNFKIGAVAGESAVADYLKNNKIKGNLFNEFNGGGYIIYHLYPQVKPFTDNRPEAYPADFFANTYYQIFEENDEELIWKSISQKYNINIIILSQRKTTEEFVKRRIDDPDWDLIMMQNQIILFTKKNPR